ncbi:receptor-type tyrosine-protein phosphatase eta isoform X6 [Cygnus olor]|uniref:receptor-type tyrosine-protein phosphatase eta isoform X6 n=1 Tax=Cygnus olor TaxID=8869 RepID=UPI001ADEBB71|nr:receptor-type tyrosine-protein phosphatase eta isoform X6 [Cygnus olor]
MRRLPRLLPCLLLLLLLPLLLLPAEVRCTIACTEDCRSKNLIADMGTSSNDDLSVNSTSRNKRSSGDGPLPGEAISDRNSVTQPRQVLDLQVADVGVTSVNLTWRVNDNASDSYTYRIEVANGTHVRNKTSNVKEAKITELIPGTKYNFTVFAVAADGQTEGEGVSVSQYTKPSKVLDLQVVDVGVTSVNLTWKVNDNASDSYTYRIEVANGTPVRNKTSDDMEAEITELIPGTKYNFTVFAVAADGQTEGEGVSISLYTKPRQVLDLKVADVGVTSVNLTWRVNDNASDSYTYRIEVANVRNKTSHDKEAEITELIPGTKYNFTVFAVAADGQTEGEGVSVSQYTKPSKVLDLQVVDVGVTSVNLTWKVNDNASDSYTYRIEVANGTPVRNKTSDDMEAEITELIPGTKYNFTVFAVAADGQTEGEGVSISLYTKPRQVLDLKVADVGVTSVNLTWRVNDNASDSYTYRIEVANVRNKTSHDKEAEITELIPGTKYNFTVFAVAADGQTEGEGVSVSQYTKPSKVLDLQVVDVGVTSVNLTWKVNDNASDSYTYRIEVANGTPVRNKTSDDKEAEITELIPGTKYNFTVFAVAADGQTEGEGVSVSQYTKPSKVLDLQVVDVGVTSVNLTWKVNDNASDSYTYRIEVANGTPVRNKTSDVKEAKITELIPGTKYDFTVFAVAADGQTEGEGVSVSQYTKPSKVLDLQVVDVGVTSVNLTWKVNDNASDSYTYRIEVANGTHVRNKTSNDKEAEITELIPGTKYNFTVFAVAADGQTEGEGVSVSQYTKPSKVLDLQVVDVGVTSVNLTWRVNDTASDPYTYRIEVANGTSIWNETSNVKEAEITELIPGTKYNFTVFAVAADGQTEGEGVTVNKSTVPSSVNSFQCESVANMSYLMLKWECPYGHYSGFTIKISFGSSVIKEEESQSCSGEGFKTPPLDYFKTYNVTVTTFSNDDTSSPVQKTCKTSITDPPTPKSAPVVKVLSHNSLSVEFFDFETLYGPLKAYAVMIITEEGGCPPLKSKLNYTYEDFKKKKTGTYVTYVADTEKAKLPSFRSQNVIDVGKGNTMYGYKNGPLTPLHSYRASVAGFTNISFTAENIIMEEHSYVSFSPCSDKVSLPQDPGVIAGAVIGCLLAILAVVAIGGYIFWTRRRKDKRNTEVSFSPIKVKKSKMIKVENFESYFKKQQADSNCGFAEEYEELKSAGVHQPKFAAEIPENRGKNRYNNVLPYDISRVKLSDLNSVTDDYINANYMPGYISKKAFIAAQGPLSNTIEDFWRMIWEKNIYSIVMLTKCVEQARTKCEQYWPDKQGKTYGDIAVTMVLETVLPEWTIRDFNVENANTRESRMVRQFHFTSWPDHGVPETTDLLINFRHHVHEYSSQNPIDSPVLVHCSAGVGRTGTFIAIDRLIQQIEIENTVDVYGVVYDLRMHRPLMVQTEDQYVFLNQCVMDIIRSQKDKKTDLIYQNTTAMAIYENFTPEPGFGKANGYHA